MLGRFLAACLLKNSSSCIKNRVVKPNENDHSNGFQRIWPISGVLSSKFGPWEQFREMGGGPRTFPGGLNKWQWKRFHEKKAREKEKKLLQQERQVYEARVRSQLRGQLLEANNHFNNNNNDDGNSSVGPMTPKDQVIALANRFMKVGAEDLWNEDDGPLTTNPEPSSPEVRGSKNVTGFNEEKDSTGGGKMYRRAPIKDNLRTNGSISFRRNFSGGPRRSRRSDRVGRFSDEEEVFQKRSSFGRAGSDSDDEEVKHKYRRFSKVERCSDDEDMGQKDSGQNSASPPKSLIEDEMELGSLIDAEMESGIRFEEDLLRSDRTSRRDFYEDDEKEFRRPKAGRMRENISSNSGLRSRRQTSRNFNEEYNETEFRRPKLGRMEDSMSKDRGSRTKRQSLKDFDEGDETDFIWPKSNERGEYISNNSGLRSRRQFSRNSNEDSDGMESRRPTLRRMGDSVSNYSGSRSKRQSLKDSDEEDTIEFRQPNPGGMGESMPKYSGPRSRRQSLKDFEDYSKTEFRQSKREAGLLSYRSTSKTQGRRDMEDDEDEGQSDLDSGSQSVSVEVFKKDQLKEGAMKKESLEAQNSKDSKEKEESYLSQTR